MPRTARQDAPGTVHHVMLRGIERRQIFRDSVDCESFLERLDRVLPECETDCFAWALMPNHVHLVLRTGGTGLATAMARIATGHALHFNRRHDRVGHLFQNRYKALRIVDDDHLRVVLRYVHRNPLRSGLVEDLEGLERHPWAGHAGLFGRHPRAFHGIEKALSLFGADRATAQRRLRTWMAEPEADATPVEARHGPGARVEHLVARLAVQLGVARRELASGARRREVSHARAVIAFVACREQGMPADQLSDLLGVCAEAVRRAAAREARRRAGRMDPGTPRSRAGQELSPEGRGQGGKRGVVRR